VVFFGGLARDLYWIAQLQRRSDQERHQSARQRRERMISRKAAKGAKKNFTLSLND
jgi:hypothetical protein